MINYIKDKGYICFDVLSGSRAYGTHHEKSDYDYRGVFIAPKVWLYGFDFETQLNNETNDLTYYEIGRFLELAQKQNPNILEILYSAEDNIRFCHPTFRKYILNYRHLFLTKNCINTFANYAVSQINKARGLNKKIVKVMDDVRRPITSFCYVLNGVSYQNLDNFLSEKNIKENSIAISKINHIKDSYYLFLDDNGEYGFKGVVSLDGTNLSLHSIPKEMNPISILYFNKDAYTIYCKEFREYHEWVKKRNPDRYETNMRVGKNYDTKNMMHCFRLLTVAEEIAKYGEIIINRPDVEELLKIKNGEYDFDDLLKIMDEKKEGLQEAYSKSKIPDYVDETFVETLLINFRREFYGDK